MRDDDAWHCTCGEWNTLPSPKKKVVYVDTFALSHMHGCIVRGNPGPWAEAYEALELAVREQAIACPWSWHHALELALTPHARDIAILTEPLAAGVQFRHYKTIQRFQAEVSFELWLDGRQIDKTVIDPSTGFECDPHCWATNERTSLVYPDRRDVDVLAARRAAKQAHKEGYAKLNERRAAARMTFEEILEEERTALGPILWEGYAAYMRRHIDLFFFNKRDDELLIDAEDHALCSSLKDIAMEKLQLSLGDANRKVREYLHSHDFMDIPSENLGSRLFAVLGERFLAPKNVPRVKPSDVTDIAIVERYAPYCDAMLLDASMADIARHPKARLEAICMHPVSIFNGRSELNAFLGWIEDARDHVPTWMRELGRERMRPERTHHLLANRGVTK
jgi:hypothetical protein